MKRTMKCANSTATTSQEEPGASRVSLTVIRCMLAIILSFGTFMMLLTTAQGATTRIKDIVEIEGVRENMLVGYGLVVGLNGTGDSLGNAPFTEQSLLAMLERLGVNVRGQSVNTENIAAVMVTAKLPPFATQGSHMDVTVATLGDSESLQGGTLLVTPLMGADGQVYAVAQGPVAAGGFSASGQAGNVTKNVPTNGKIPNGAIIEREIDFNLEDMKSVRLSLRNPDFTTARRVADAINGRMGPGTADVLDHATVRLTAPPNVRDGIVGAITDIENLPVEPDQIARVVVDENSGIIVMGKDVRISTVAIAQGNLTIRVTETPQVSQPQAFAQQGQTTVVPRTQLSVDDDSEKKLAVLETGVTLQELVEGLNALGIGPRDIISILQSIKAAGALQADIEIM